MRIARGALARKGRNVPNGDANKAFSYTQQGQSRKRRVDESLSSFTKHKRVKARLSLPGNERQFNEALMQSLQGGRGGVGGEKKKRGFSGRFSTNGYPEGVVGSKIGAMQQESGKRRRR